MNKIIFLSFILLFITSCVKAQVIFKTDYQSQADYLLFLIEDKWEADILVYWSKSKLWATHDYRDGTWYKTEYKSEADIIIGFTDYKSRATVLIYIVNDKFEAGAKSGKGSSFLNHLEERKHL